MGTAIQTAVVGIDVSKDTLDACLLLPTGKAKEHAFGNDARGQAVLVAQLDNLGKGASGAAVQNIRLMLGLSDEDGEAGRAAPQEAAYAG